MTSVCEKQGTGFEKKQRVAMGVKQPKLTALSHHCSSAVAEEVLFKSLMSPSVSASLIFTVGCTRDACKTFSRQIRPQWRIKVAGSPMQLPSFVK